MSSAMEDLLLVKSFSLDGLIDQYRLFFQGLLPCMFILAVLIEFFDRMEPFSLVKRAFISIIILTSITSFYHSSIKTSMDAADDFLKGQKAENILLMDMFDGLKHWGELNKRSSEKDFCRCRYATKIKRPWNK